jgi:hypothetical protein
VWCNLVNAVLCGEYGRVGIQLVGKTGIFEGFYFFLAFSYFFWLNNLRQYTRKTVSETGFFCRTLPTLECGVNRLIVQLVGDFDKELYITMPIFSLLLPLN